jgi:hypothetical protein
MISYMKTIKPLMFWFSTYLESGPFLKGEGEGEGETWIERKREREREGRKGWGSISGHLSGLDAADPNQVLGG